MGATGQGGHVARLAARSEEAAAAREEIWELIERAEESEELGCSPSTRGSSGGRAEPSEHAVHLSSGRELRWECPERLEPPPNGGAASCGSIVRPKARSPTRLHEASLACEPASAGSVRSEPRLWFRMPTTHQERIGEELHA